MGDSIRVERTTYPAGPPSRGACEAAVRLGVVLDDLAGSRSPPEPFELRIGESDVVLIDGASGVGKTTLLGDMRRAMRNAGWIVVRPPVGRLRDRACVDLFACDVESAMRRLAGAGLGELGAFVRRARELSEGQRERLRLALGMERAEAASRRAGRLGVGAALLVDEFGGKLDSVTAISVARLVRRFAARTGVRVVVATARDDLSAALAPALRLSFDAVGRLRIRERATPANEFCSAGIREHEIDLHFDLGTRKDYDSLAPLHYRCGAPAVIERVLCARDKGRGELAGVLVVSRPVLNAGWRDLAWPGRYSTSDKRASAQRVNDELRCISRVIVDPRYRGLGVARRLVASYLDRPLTICTEALAAMGAACPFFGGAGMTEYTLTPSRRDARLLDALNSAGVERWRLATPTAALANAVRGSSREFVQREVRMWARSSRSTWRWRDEEIETLFVRACRGVGATAVAYAHTAAADRHRIPCDSGAPRD